MKEITLGKGRNSTVQQLQRVYGGSWISTKVNKKPEWISNKGMKAVLDNNVIRVIYEI